MENNEELWMQYIRQRTENSRDFLNRTGLVFGAGFGSECIRMQYFFL